MAWAKGTATDFIDFLRKFRDYAAGLIDPASDPDITDGEQVPLAERWAIQVNGALQPALPGSGMATDGEVYLIGPGSDPADEIVVGFKTYRNAGNNIFGWEIKGYTQFNDTLAFTTMPGVSPSSFAAFDDATFDVAFWVNARRIMALAIVGTTPILVHVGFVQQFALRSQYPYPLLISGSVSDNATNFQANHFGQACLPDPCDNGGWLRWVDGTWQEVRHYTNSNAQRSNAREASGGYKLWPQRDTSTTDSAETGLTQGNEEDLFEQFAVTGTQISNSEIDAYPLFPCILHSANQLVGRLDGLYVAAGLGLTTGDTITDQNSPADIYDVYANTWRTESIDFFAILRD